MRSLPQKVGFVNDHGKIPRFYFGVGKPRLCGMGRLAAITFLFVRRPFELILLEILAVSNDYIRSSDIPESAEQAFVPMICNWELSIRLAME
jgi:hypothetical protein